MRIQALIKCVTYSVGHFVWRWTGPPKVGQARAHAEKNGRTLKLMAARITTETQVAPVRDDLHIVKGKAPLIASQPATVWPFDHRPRQIEMRRHADREIVIDTISIVKRAKGKRLLAFGIHMFRPLCVYGVWSAQLLLLRHWTAESRDFHRGREEAFLQRL